MSLWSDTGTQGDGKQGRDDWGMDWSVDNDHPMELLSRIRLLIAALAAVGTVVCLWLLASWMGMM
jgi:hypothetical protein